MIPGTPIVCIPSPTRPCVRDWQGHPARGVVHEVLPSGRLVCVLWGIWKEGEEVCREMEVDEVEAIPGVVSGGGEAGPQ